MRCPESIEKMHERDTRLYGCQMGDRRHIESLLHTCGSQHRKSGLPYGHHILVVAENRKRLFCKAAGRNMEDTWQKFASYLVHIRNHQQESLRSRESGCQRTGLQRTVHGTCRTGLALHLSHLYDLTEKVLLSGSGPLVHIFGHRRRRRDRINCSMLAEQISYMCGGIVAIAGNEFFFFSHNM